MTRLGSGLARLFAVVLVGAMAQGAAAQGADGWRHGLSLMGDLKYPADFKNFSYVNPDAPKGGLVRLSTEAAFDTFNVILPKGVPAPGLASLIYQNLMRPSMDEASTQYGDLAEAVKYPADFSSVTYRLRSDAKWHDGKPVTSDDVIWSFQTLMKLNPAYAFYYAGVSKIAKTADREVTFTFDAAGNREKPHIMGQLLVLPKHWWEGSDANGKPRDLSQGTLEPPLGSGPYKIKNFEAGRSITYERVKDWWGAGVPANVGQFNLDEIRFDTYRDDTVELEAFKADEFDWRTEASAKNWATAYNFPAVKQKKVIVERFPERSRGLMQAFAFNLRRDKFKDVRVRRAFNLAFDFEEMNRSLFYDQYERINSYFHGTELVSSGLPQGRELEILQAYRGQIPDDIFIKPYENPKGGTAAAFRDNLREAAKILEEAGWTIKDRKLVNKTSGEVLRAEFLLNSPAMERIVLPYKLALERLGFDISIRTVDAAQYVERLRNRDFDVIVGSWAQSLSPGNEQREFWGSAAADRDGSRNLIGIKNDAIDKLIERVVFATDRDDLLAATRALDRVLLWSQFVVPHFTYPYDRTARWDRFSHPAQLPTYSYGFPDIWWYDRAKAASVGERR